MRTRVRGDGGVTGCVESACLERSGSVPSGTGGLGTAARPTGSSSHLSAARQRAACGARAAGRGCQECAWDSRASGRDLF